MIDRTLFLPNRTEPNLFFAEPVRPYWPNMFGRICRTCSAVFAESVRPYLPNVHHITSACDIRVHRAGSLFPRDLLPQVIIQHFTCHHKTLDTLDTLDILDTLDTLEAANQLISQVQNCHQSHEKGHISNKSQD